MKYADHWGEAITASAAKMIALARASGEDVTCDFNGVMLVANQTTHAADIVAHYWTETERRYKKYEASPAGQQAARDAEEYQRKAAAAQAEGLLPFAIGDAAAWQSWLDSNKDGYGAACCRYAARWACLMDKAIADGATVRDCADAKSREADVEGITGFMYGAAVTMLSKCWAHGEELRRWHNKDTQLGTEGDRANESGAVLNPALLTIG